MSNDFKVYSKPNECEKDWKELEINADIDIFQTYDWSNAWTKNFDSIIEKIYIYIFYQSKKPIFIAPLVVTKKNNFKVLNYIGEPLNDYNQPIIRKGVEITKKEIDKFWKKIFNETEYDLVHLTREKKGYSHKSKVTTLKGHYIKIYEDWDLYYKNSRTKKARYNISRQERLLKEKGDLKYSINSSNNIDNLINTMIGLKSKFYDKNRIKNNFKSKEYKKRFTSFYKDLADKNILKISCLYLKKNIIAIHMGYEYKSHFYYIFPAYNLEYSKYSPGILLQKKILETVFIEKKNIFDFTIGDENYKFSWANNTVSLSETIFGKGLKGFLIYVFLISKHKIKSILKK